MELVRSGVVVPARTGQKLRCLCCLFSGFAVAPATTDACNLRVWEHATVGALTLGSGATRYFCSGCRTDSVSGAC